MRIFMLSVMLEHGICCRGLDLKAFTWSACGCIDAQGSRVFLGLSHISLQKN